MVRQMMAGREDVFDDYTVAEFERAFAARFTFDEVVTLSPSGRVLYLMSATMNTTRKLVATSAWLGFALAALFFYPLAVALDSDLFYMQWQRRDTLETLAALALLSIVFGALVFVSWRRTGRASTLALAAVAAFPFASLLAGLLRQLPFDDALIAAGNNPLLRYAVPGLIAGAILLAYVRWPNDFGRWLRRGLLVISFASVVVIASLVRAASYDASVVDVQRKTPKVAHRRRLPVGCGAAVRRALVCISVRRFRGPRRVSRPWPPVGVGDQLHGCARASG